MEIKKIKNTIYKSFNIKIGDLYRLTGGEKNIVYHILGTQYVMRIYQKSANRTGIAFEHLLLSELNKRLNYISAPILTEEGKSYVEVDGSPIAIMRYIEGYTPRREDCTMELCCQAGKYLGEIHKCSYEIMPSLERKHFRKSVYDIDFYLNDMYDWEKAKYWLNGTVMASELTFLEKSLEYFSDKFGSAKTPAAKIPIHGDYYKGNLLCRGGDIVGVIDFDDTKYEVPEYELARSLWEFARQTNQVGFNGALVNSYMAGYKRAYPHKVTTEKLLIYIDFIRVCEILSDATSMINGDLLEGFDYKYNMTNLKWSKEIRMGKIVLGRR